MGCFFLATICLNYTCIIYTFFNLRLHVFHVHIFGIIATAVAHGIIALLKKKSIFNFMDITYKHIFLNFGVISCTNNDMVFRCFNCTVINVIQV